MESFLASTPRYRDCWSRALISFKKLGAQSTSVREIPRELCNLHRHNRLILLGYWVERATEVISNDMRDSPDAQSGVA